jgi:hypothetical protein
MTWLVLILSGLYLVLGSQGTLGLGMAPALNPGSQGPWTRDDLNLCPESLTVKVQSAVEPRGGEVVWRSF